MKQLNFVERKFHITKENTVIVRGFVLPQYEKEEFSAEALLDGKRIPLKTTVNEGFEVHLRYAGYKFDINKEITYLMELPQGWQTADSLSVYVTVAGNRILFYKEKVKKLVVLQNSVNHMIDQVSVTADGYLVQGWAASTEPIHLSVWQKNRRLDAVQIKQSSRPDVLEQNPGMKKADDWGFELRIPGEVSGTVTLQIASGKKLTHAPIHLNTEKLIAKAGADSTIGKGLRYLDRHGVKTFLKRAADKLHEKQEDNYETYRMKVRPTEKEFQAQREKKFAVAPKISIVVPLYKTPLTFLKELTESVKQQTYANWELVLSDGSGPHSPLEKYLKNLARADKRVKIVYTGKQLDISANTNEAIKAAAGEYIAFADHDDLLEPHALYECVRAIQKYPQTELIYSDEDKVDGKGKKYFEPHFKSDFNIDLLRSMNYFCHLVVVKASLMEKVGMLNSEYHGAQDYDFVLRCVEQTDAVYHIPKVLYHWRAHTESTAENPESKRYAFTAGKRAVQAHYDRLGIPATVEEGEYPGLYRTYYHWEEKPLVSIIIPNKDHIEDLETCVNSIFEKSEYRNFEFIIVENNSTEKETFEYYKQLEAAHANVKVVYWKEDFNYSKINNFGASYANGEYLLLLNNDTQIKNGTCIGELLGYCMREDVGIVGARLYYDDMTIQHAGVVIGFGGIAGHAFIGMPGTANGYFSRIICAQDYSAVTAACMMTKKEIFMQVGGLTEELKVAFNDIDYCMKVRKQGKLVVYNPYAELFHYESKSRGLEDTPEKKKRFHDEVDLFNKRWKDYVKDGDPYYNVNLSLDRADFAVRRLG